MCRCGPRRRVPGIFLLPLLWLAAPLPAFAEAVPVRLEQAADGWRLLRGGAPYFIRGAGGDASLQALAQAGANSVRTWGADDIGPLLDEAHALGLTVTVGIWLGHEAHGFDYRDPEQVAGQMERARQTVLRYRDHPAVLLWGIGNEMEGLRDGDDPRIWRAVNEVAAMVKALDPHHPTMTVTADIGGGRIEAVHERCPAIDIHGINSYGGALTLVERLRAGGATKPFILTEFGPPGMWESPTTAWGAPVELTSTEKADFYLRSYRQAIEQSAGMALGAYAFLWGSKVEGTQTWFGMFLADGGRLAAVDAMTGVWTGSPPANRVPEVQPLTVAGPRRVPPGREVRVGAQVRDPEGDPLDVRWLLRREFGVADAYTHLRPELFDIDGAVLAGDASGARVRMPGAPGPYRLFVFVRDAAGGVATANLPLYVEGEARTPMPFHVYADGFDHMPWAPSGWMGSFEGLTLDGEHHDNPYDGESCIRLRFVGDPGSWVGVAWQHPPNNWGDKDGGYDLGGANYLELWARGEYGFEKIDIGVGLLEADKAFPDSGKRMVERVALDTDWQRLRIPLDGLDLASIKTGFVIILKGDGTSVNVYLDAIRFVR